MKAAPFDFRKADSLSAAFGAYAEADGEAKYLAGGQSLGPMLNLRFSQPDRLIDISAMAELRGVQETDTEVILGAAIRHAEIEDGLVPDASAGFMARVARNIAYRAVRNRGTVGGSLAHADPVADWPNVLTALGGRVVLAGPDGTRELALEEFFLGPLTPAMQAEEILTAVRIPRLGPDVRPGIGKFCRKVGELAHCLSVVLHKTGGGSRAVMGCIAGTPILLPMVGEWLDRLKPKTAEPAPDELSAALSDDLARAGVTADALELRMHRATLMRAVRESLS